MKYKKILFDIPVGWNINKCFIKIEDGKIIIDHPVDHNVFERCTSPLLDGDNYQIFWDVDYSIMKKMREKVLDENLI